MGYQHSTVVTPRGTHVRVPRHTKTRKFLYRDQTWDIHPYSWGAFEGDYSSPYSLGSTSGSPMHSGSVSEHADSILYYGTFGLLDPKMPFEAYGYKKAFGFVGFRGLMFAAGLSMGGGFLLAATLGYMFDPMDRRKGGIMQSQAWKEIITPGEKKFLHFR